METSFGFATTNITEISNWRQLLNLTSSLENVKCKVTNVEDGICNGTSITIYNSQTNFNYITFFVSGEDSGSVPLSEVCVTKEEAIAILNNFGYAVTYVDGISLTTNTRTLLTDYKSLGYNFIYKDTTGEVFVSAILTQTIATMQGISIIDSPLYEKSQFTFLNKLTAYGIQNLLDGDYSPTIQTCYIANLTERLTQLATTNVLVAQLKSHINAIDFNVGIVTDTPNTFDLSVGNDSTVIGYFTLNNSVLTLNIRGNGTIVTPALMYNFFGFSTQINSITFNGVLDTSNTTSMSGLFSNFVGTALDISTFDISKVTDVSSMFSGCTTLTTLTLPTFANSKITNFSNMFKNCNAIPTFDVSTFNTSYATNTSSMFENCTTVTQLDLTNFKTNLVTDATSMFASSANLVLIKVSSDWDMTSATTTNMFNGCGTDHVTVVNDDD